MRRVRKSSVKPERLLESSPRNSSEAAKSLSDFRFSCCGQLETVIDEPATPKETAKAEREMDDPNRRDLHACRDRTGCHRQTFYLNQIDLRASVTSTIEGVSGLGTRR